MDNDVKKPHAVLIKDGVVWDFLGVQDLEEYQKENTIMTVVLDYDSRKYRVVKSVE